jgi:hypothetical protein
MLADPLAFGTMDAENSVRDPREYFLFVFHVRIKQVMREWDQVVSKLQKSVHAYEYVSCLRLSVYRLT